jgi:hypothetical protein
MARMAATDYAADWVFNADGDEFWWPRYGDLGTVLAGVPASFGIVRCPSRTFIPAAEGDGFFAERMTVRVSGTAPINDPTSPYRPEAKVAHRARSDVSVDRGSHAVAGAGLEQLPGLFPIEVLHFPLRDALQAAEKERTWTKQLAGRSAGARYRRQGRGRYGSFAVEGDELGGGLADGALTIDTRLRDALRRLRLPAPVGVRRFALPVELAAPLALPRPTAAEEAEYGVDASIFEEGELTRLQRRLDLAQRRVAVNGSGPR